MRNVPVMAIPCHAWAYRVYKEFSLPNFQCHISLVKCVGLIVVLGFMEEESKSQRDWWDRSESAFQMERGKSQN